MGLDCLIIFCDKFEMENVFSRLRRWKAYFMHIFLYLYFLCLSVFLFQQERFSFYILQLSQTENSFPNRFCYIVPKFAKDTPIHTMVPTFLLSHPAFSTS